MCRSKGNQEEHHHVGGSPKKRHAQKQAVRPRHAFALTAHLLGKGLGPFLPSKGRTPVNIPIPTKID